jgi:hypothetical protein
MGRVERLRRVKPERCPVAASPVRRVEITPEVEREALVKLAACGEPEPWRPFAYQGEDWAKVAP